jgi:hypothetical protein
MMRRRHLAVTLTIAFLLMVAAASEARASSATVYVDPGGSCGGKAPCYLWISQALSSVSNGGTVVITSNTNDNIISPATPQNITIKGETPGITLTGGGGVNVTAGPVVGWTIQDLNFTGGFLIRDISGSLTVRNISTTGMTIGSFTQDTTADITIANNVLPNDDAAVISVLSDPGHDINGSILIQDNSGVDAINIFTRVANGVQADLTADITISGNSLRRGANIGVDSLGASGTGNVTGAVVFSNNTMGEKIGLTINGAATGDITGPVTFSGNTGLWLAALTVDSVVGGNITGGIDVSGNDVEFVEVIAKGTLSGTVFIDANQITDKPGGVAQGPTIQAEGAPMAADVTVRATTGSVAYVSVRSRSGNLSGQVKALENAVGWIEIDSQGGSITAPFELTQNQLPTNPLPGSPLGAYSYVSVHTGAAGNLGGGTIAGSSMDRLQFDLSGTLTGTMAISGNLFRDYASFILNGARPSPALLSFTGNDVPKTTYIDGFRTAAHFNRHLGKMTVVPGSNVAAENNWWGCSQGPGNPGCADKPTSPTAYSPWLTFTSVAACTAPDSLIMNFGVLRNSSGGVPVGNTTPGSVTIVASSGSVLQTPVSLGNGAGSTEVVFPAASPPTITTELDSQVILTNAECAFQRDTIGTIRPSNGAIYLKNRNATGYADLTFSYGVPGDLFIAGDWDHNNTATIGNFRSGVFYLRNSNTTGFADITFGYGLPGDKPIAGDWNNDGVDTVGVFRNGVFYLRNSNSTGYAQVTFGYGIPGDIPLAGDWNGDGVDTVGVFRNGIFYLHNSNSTGYADLTFGYGLPGDMPIAGDWNNDGVDTVGVFRNGVFYLRNSNTTGYADLTFAYGVPGDKPLAGDWDGLP